MNFNDSWIDLQLFWWISSPYQKDVIYSRSEVLRKARHALDAAGMSSPFPVRMLDFSMARRDKSGDGNKLMADYLDDASANGNHRQSSHVERVDLEKRQE